MRRYPGSLDLLGPTLSPKGNNKEATQMDNIDMRKMGGDKRPLFYSFRLYLNSNGERVLGKGGALILEAIDEHGSIALAAEELGMSYKFVWDYLGRMKQGWDAL